MSAVLLRIRVAPEADFSAAAFVVVVSPQFHFFLLLSFAFVSPLSLSRALPSLALLPSAVRVRNSPARARAQKGALS